MIFVGAWLATPDVNEGPFPAQSLRPHVAQSGSRLDAECLPKFTQQRTAVGRAINVLPKFLLYTRRK